MTTSQRWILIALGMGMAVPLVYFGSQLIAAPFYPGYSFLIHSASELGSERSTLPVIQHIGALLTGIVTLAASVGFWGGLRRLNVHPILAALPALAVAVNGLSSLWAGIFPLPDPRHGANPFTIGVFAFPVLLLIAVWKQPRTQPLKIYLIINMLLFLAMIPVMSGMLPIDRGSYQGLLQRIAALIFFLPIGIGAYFLSKRIRELPAAS